MDHHSDIPNTEPTAVVFDRSAPTRGTVPLRTVLGSPTKAPGSRARLGRAAWAFVGVACVGGAVGVIEVLFPETGPATAESVWQTPAVARQDATVTTMIATADIDFEQVSADAWARRAQDANTAAGTQVSGAPSSVLGIVVSGDPAVAGTGSTARASATGSGSTTSGSPVTSGATASASTTTRPSTSGAQPVSTSTTSSSASTTRNTSTSSTSTSTTRTTSTSSTSSTTPANTSSSLPDTSTSGPDDNGGGSSSGSGSGGSGGGSSGKG